MTVHEKHYVEEVDMTRINPKWFNEFRHGGEVVEELSMSNPKRVSISEEELELLEVGKTLGRVMKSISRELKGQDAHCKVCGGLKEEIVIDFNGKRYIFTCHKIESLKTKKTIRETNYQKFSKYLNPDKKKPEKKKSANLT